MTAFTPQPQETPATRQRATPSRAATSSRTFNYLAIRVSGVLLAVLVLGHFVVTHITTDVVATNAGFIAQRWSSALWLVWDWLMLAAALLHGGVGVGIAVDDYATGPARRVLRRGILCLCIGLFGFGSYLIANAVLS